MMQAFLEMVKGIPEPSALAIWSVWRSQRSEFLEYYGDSAEREWRRADKVAPRA